MVTYEARYKQNRVEGIPKRDLAVSRREDKMRKGE